MRNWEGPKLLALLASCQGLPFLPGKPWTQNALEKAWYSETEGVAGAESRQSSLLWDENQRTGHLIPISHSALADGGHLHHGHFLSRH